LIPAFLSYLALRLAVDLVPQTATIAEAAARGASAYINRVRGFDNHLSFTALGGPAIGLAVLYLVWRWRRAGGVGRLVAASTLPLAWFAWLPAVTPEVSAGPIAAFSWGAGHGLFWLTIAGLAGALLPLTGESHPTSVLLHRRPVHHIHDNPSAHHPHKTESVDSGVHHHNQIVPLISDAMST
jgi:hypothetical protein